MTEKELEKLKINVGTALYMPSLGLCVVDSIETKIKKSIFSGKHKKVVAYLWLRVVGDSNGLSTRYSRMDFGLLRSYRLDAIRVFNQARTLYVELEAKKTK